MLLNWAMNRMNGPRFLPSGRRLGPYFCRRAAASPASRPCSVLVASRLSTSSTVIACQAVPSAVVSALTAAAISSSPSRSIRLDARKTEGPGRSGRKHRHRSTEASARPAATSRWAGRSCSIIWLATVQDSAWPRAFRCALGTWASRRARAGSYGRPVTSYRMCLQAPWAKGRTSTRAAVPNPIGLDRRAGADDNYFLPFLARLSFDPAAASRRRLPILKRTARVAGISGFRRSAGCGRGGRRAH